MARFVVLVIDSFGVGAMKDVTLVRPQDAGGIRFSRRYAV